MPEAGALDGAAARAEARAALAAETLGGAGARAAAEPTPQAGPPSGATAPTGARGVPEAGARAEARAALAAEPLGGAGARAGVGTSSGTGRLGATVARAEAGLRGEGAAQGEFGGPGCAVPEGARRDGVGASARGTAAGSGVGRLRRSAAPLAAKPLPDPPGDGSRPDQNAPHPSPEPSHPTGKFLAKAAVLTAALSIAGSLLGLVRDQALARLFGAGQETDAFLVAWTIPEFAATLLIEDGMAFALIPAFSMALARKAQGASGDPVRALVAGTLPKLALAFMAVGALVIGLAPQVVEALAPGLSNPRLAVDCTRLTATCVVSFGLAGYCSAALRAHRTFGAPAAIYVAYNTGIIAGMFVLGGHWGVRSAAAGVAVGGVLMVLVQLPALLKQLTTKAAVQDKRGNQEPQALNTALLATVLLFALCRQSQVLIERFLASRLPEGAISHLNYAQKVAQMPMLLSMMLITVTFPVVARALAEGDTERARKRVESDLALATCVVLLGTAAIVACAPQIIQLLFQKGAFTPEDTAATATVMRVYALGLLGQTLTGVLVRSYFSAGRPSWYPVGAMAAGIVVTSWIGALSVGSLGVTGIAVANAAGISVTALVLLAGLGPKSVPVHVRGVLHELSRPVRAALVATVLGAYAAGHVAGGPIAGAFAGGLTVTAVFLVLCWALDAQGVEPVLSSVRSASRRLAAHVRSR
ncbi:murein biosynthesis integral membrane protein MurJ [Streptomyces acidiscabies]|uniref:Membrane protein n=1 Tax=Streptomyces acidiscabies TaxID=42234 RepID=A0A0L0KD10_9ACTN|nr:lipid II flippase MurJ [Streptomyces acidiscabies]KND35570.1 membrane protein [Streptomyces acidiscabies]